MKKEDMKFLESLLKEREEPKNIEYTNIIKNKYPEELEDFNYIHNLDYSIVIYINPVKQKII